MTKLKGSLKNKKKKRKQHEPCKFVHPGSEYFLNVTSFLSGNM